MHFATVWNTQFEVDMNNKENIFQQNWVLSVILLTNYFRDKIRSNSDELSRDFV